ncbi:MAG: hypothetical protein AAF637_07250 [Pseudomonadota bacterium]
MRRVLGVAAGAAMALTVSGAAADSMTGTVTDINTTANTFRLHGTTWTAGENNVVGLRVGDLQDGDKIRITFSSRDFNSGRSPVNVMSITKEE